MMGSYLSRGVLIIAVLLVSMQTVIANRIPGDIDIVELQLSFTDAKWDGKIIPSGQQCLEYGGNGASPGITVEGIPHRADKIILEFSDATYSPCDNGGHGIIGYQLPQRSTAINIPSIPGQTFELPEGFILIKEHCGADLIMQRGAYIGPCPGIGNRYYVTIKAVRQGEGNSSEIMLGMGTLELGTYLYE